VAGKKPVVEQSGRGRGKSDAWFGECVHGSIDDSRSGAVRVKRFIRAESASISESKRCPRLA
jgi:hypothetical protein